MKDYSIFQNTFQNINSSIKETKENLEESEIFIGASPRTMIFNFKEKVLMILKAILLEKKIIVFSLHSQSCSNFILSILSLFPGFLNFNFNSQDIYKHELNYEEYGFPLKFYDFDQKLLRLYFTINELDNFKNVKSFLIGTTN